MDVLTLLVVFVILCTLLWVVNASGWMALPPPVKMGFNILVVIIFIVIVLQVSGVYSFHDLRVGPR